jgi:NTP pyrophosphatase (non-canonical NTP hydrolase)
MIYGKTFCENGSQAMLSVFLELRKAEAKHPRWPEDPIHAVAILVEEAGESMQAALDYTYSGGDIERLREELAQTVALAIRALLHLDNYAPGGAR